MKQEFKRGKSKDGKETTTATTIDWTLKGKSNDSGRRRGREDEKMTRFPE